MIDKKGIATLGLKTSGIGSTSTPVVVATSFSADAVTTVLTGDTVRPVLMANSGESSTIVAEMSRMTSVINKEELLGEAGC